MIVRNKKIKVENGKSNTSFNGEDLHNFIMSNGGSASYHEICVNFGLISQEDMDRGTPLNSSMRNKIRKSWGGYNGRNQKVDGYQINSKGQHFVCQVGGTQMVGENKNISSQVLEIKKVDKNGNVVK